MSEIVIYSGLNFTNRVCGTSLCTYYNVICCDGYSPMYTSTNYICGPVPVDTPTTCSSSSFQELSAKGLFHSFPSKQYIVPNWGCSGVFAHSLQTEFVFPM